MKKEEKDIEVRLVDNIRNLINDRGLNQYGLSVASGISDKTISKIFTGQQHFKMEHIAKIARCLSVREIDLFTYPERYERVDVRENGPAEVLLQLKLSKEKKDQVLKLVFGENNIEIFNK